MLLAVQNLALDDFSNAWVVQRGICGYGVQDLYTFCKRLPGSVHDTHLYVHKAYLGCYLVKTK